MEKIILKMTTNGRAQIPMKIRNLKNIREGDTLVVDLEEVIHVGDEDNRTVEAPA